MPRTKIPTKSELIQLQRLYKTDDKIAERLGGVSSQLVAYWRRKKNVPRNTFPKFSEREVRDLWERFGDDYRCGLEIGISKAAFYNWRRKYKILEKPDFLKLEQLELNLDDSARAAIRRANYGRQTISQKIMAEKAGAGKVDVGEPVEVEADLAICDENSGAVIRKFREAGGGFVWNSNRVVIILNENGGCLDPAQAEENFSIRDFARRQNMKYFYDTREGACHQVILERGHALPGYFVAGVEQFAVAHGAVGSFTFNLGIEGMAGLWMKGRHRTAAPQTIKVILDGRIPDGVAAEDIALSLISSGGRDSLKEKALEFYGAAVPQLSIPERFTLSHQSAALGVCSAIFPFDSVTRRFFIGRTKMPYRPALADKDADYAGSIEINLSSLAPQVGRLFGSRKVGPVDEISGTSVQLVLLGSCANGRYDDLKIAADIIKGRKIHPEVRFFVVPGSRAVYLEALKKGLIRVFVEAGAVVMSPGQLLNQKCGSGIVSSGEKCLTSSFQYAGEVGGNRCGEVFVASPATCAASAIKGEIVNPVSILKQVPNRPSSILTLP